MMPNQRPNQDQIRQAKEATRPQPQVRPMPESEKRNAATK